MGGQEKAIDEATWKMLLPKSELVPKEGLQL
jgi:hypothetical protein